MTPIDLPPDASAALVDADRPPDLPDDRFVDVHPGIGASFDGTRYRVAIHVVGPGGHRRRYDNHDIAAVASAARAHLRERDVSLVRLDARARPQDPWWVGTVGAIERRLLAVARREGATLVTWADAGRRSADGVDYDVVVSRSPGATR